MGLISCCSKILVKISCYSKTDTQKKKKNRNKTHLLTLSPLSAAKPADLCQTTNTSICSARWCLHKLSRIKPTSRDCEYNRGDERGKLIITLGNAWRSRISVNTPNTGWLCYQQRGHFRSALVHEFAKHSGKLSLTNSSVAWGCGLWALCACRGPALLLNLLSVNTVCEGQSGGRQRGMQGK